jgi:hypothetical protein
MFTFVVYSGYELQGANARYWPVPACHHRQLWVKKSPLL